MQLKTAIRMRREDSLKRRGVSSILCWRRTLRSTNTSPGLGDRVKSITECHPTEAGITRRWQS